MGVEALACGIFYLHVNLLVGDFYIHTVVVAVHKYREFVATIALVAVAVTVGVAAQHNINAGLVEQWQEEAAQFVVTIPACTLVKGDV